MMKKHGAGPLLSRSQLVWTLVTILALTVGIGAVWLVRQIWQKELSYGELALVAVVTVGLVVASWVFNRTRVKIVEVDSARNESQWRQKLLESHSERQRLSDLLEIKDEHCRKLDGLVERQQARFVELEKKIADAEKQAGLNVVAELRQSREGLEAARDSFVSYLQDFFFPVGEKYEGFLDQSETLHERMAVLIDSLDGSLATLGVEGGAPVIKFSLPLDPHETFLGVGAIPDEQALNAAEKKIVNIFHSDKMRHLGLKWVVDLYDVVMKYLLQQREALREAEGAK